MYRIFLKLARSARQGVIPIFVAVNLFLFHHALTHLNFSSNTPDSITCYDFPETSGESYLVPYAEWKQVIPQHLNIDENIGNEHFEAILNLNKIKQANTPSLLLPTCITASATVYQFWDREASGNMERSDVACYKVSTSPDRQMICMTRDIIHHDDDDARTQSTEEAYIIRLKEGNSADIIHMIKSPCFFYPCDKYYMFIPCPKRRGEPLSNRDITMNIYRNVKFHSSAFHHAVNYKVPKDTDNTYIRFWINPFIAGSLELQKAELRTNAYFHINHLDARVYTKRHLLEFYNKYPHSQCISLACHYFLAQPQAYSAHPALRRKWTFFTFDAASYFIPELTNMH